MRPSVSAACTAGDHERCPHWAALRVRGAWRLRPRQVAVVCRDPWHGGHGCPLAGRREVPADELRSRCTCPGVAAFRRSSERFAARRDRERAVVAAIDLADRPDAATVEQRLSDGFAAAGGQPPPGLAALSVVLAARSRAPGTRTARLSWLGLRAAGGAVRDTWRPGGPHGSRALQAGGGAVLTVAVLLTALVVRTPGWWRAAVAVPALLAWRVAARAVAIGAVVTVLDRRQVSASSKASASSWGPNTDTSR